jgi:hypothetical protein
MIATEAVYDDALVSQADPAVASGDERQIAFLAPELVPRHRHFRAHRDLPGQLDIASSARDIAVDCSNPGKGHQDRYALLRDPAHFLVANASLTHGYYFQTPRKNTLPI